MGCHCHGQASACRLAAFQRRAKGEQETSDQLWAVAGAGAGRLKGYSYYYLFKLNFNYAPIHVVTQK
jgi:hypothetical protein